ncbi:hypothetical protein BDA99DRAFT_565165 [Phascolomyces articulosus]|uniref:F-box domain-containing protein n=1 Tax=Phascolomyces articulosus TaxID=60185 RepID=A0AAD5JNV5_9FUNG|nr:hypothetical protein BDA99DRAFT_565165 [Phascolomyces articulosus]
MAEQNPINESASYEIRMKETTPFSPSTYRNNDHKAKLNKDTQQNIDFIANLPLELIILIMKQFSVVELFDFLSVSKEWQHQISSCSSLWTTLSTSWSLNHDLSKSNPLAAIVRHVENLDLGFENGELNLITRALLDQMDDGNFCKLRKFEMQNCYISNNRMFHIPVKAISHVSNTLKMFEMDYDEYRQHDDDRDHKQRDNYKGLFIPIDDSVTVDIFTPILSIISTCKHLDYFRYANIHLNSDSEDINEMNINITMVNPQLTQLEIELGSIKASNFISLLKLCPNLRVLRAVTFNQPMDHSILDSISQYCPGLEYLTFGFDDDWWFGEDLYSEYHPDEYSASTLLTETQQQQQQPLSSLQELHIKIHNIDHVVSFLDRHSQTIQKMMVSLYLNNNDSFASMQPLEQLDSLVVGYTEDPNILATLLSRLPALQLLKLDEADLGSNNVIHALRTLDTLEELIIGNDTYVYEEDIIELFRAYAERPVTTILKQHEEFITVDCSGLYLARIRQPGQLTFISLYGCNGFLFDEVLEEMGRIKTLSTVYIGFTDSLTCQGINNFCQQLKMLPNFFSIGLAGLACVDDSTLAILGSARNISSVCLRALDNITQEGLNVYKDLKKNDKKGYIFTTDCKNIKDRYL